MDSKFTNSDLVGATLKIYNEFSSKQKTTIAIKKERDINKNKSVILIHSQLYGTYKRFIIGSKRRT